MTTTKFNPTDIMHQVGKVDVPVIIIEKRDALWLVVDENGQKFWVGKDNVYNLQTWTNLRNKRG